VFLSCEKKVDGNVGAVMERHHVATHTKDKHCNLDG